MSNKAIERFSAIAGLFAVLALSACSGDDGENTDSISEGSAPGNVAGAPSVSSGGSSAGKVSGGSSKGGTGGSGSSGSGSSSGVGDDAGMAGVSGEGSAEGGIGGDSGAPDVGGSSGTGGDTGSTGGTATASGGTGGTGGSVSVGGSSGTSGTGGSSVGGSSSSGGSSGNGGTSAGTGGTNSVGGTSSVGGSSSTGGTGGTATASGGTGGTNSVGGTGGSVSVGGSSGTSGTGGSSVGGSSSSGGSSGNGGTSAGTGGTNSVGGTSSVGGSSSTGGTGGSSGSGGTGGSSGSSGTGGSAGVGGSPPMTSFACSTWAKDSSFPSSLYQFGEHVPGRAVTFGASDEYVPVVVSDGSFASSGGSLSNILHKSGSSWSIQTLPSASVYTYIHEVAGADANHVYAVGAKYEGSFYKGVILERLNKGAWQEVKAFSLNYPDITSVWCAAADDCFATVQHRVATDTGMTETPSVYRGSGSDWSEMSTPAINGPNGGAGRVSGSSADDVFVTGAADTAFLWYFDGDTWADVTTLPSEVTMINDVSSKDGEVNITGATSTTGIRCTSINLVDDWDCNESADSQSDAAVLTVRRGAALSGGSLKSPFLGTVLATRSKDVWSEDTDELPTSEAYGISSIVPVSGTQVLLTTARQSQIAVYTATCQ